MTDTNPGRVVIPEELAEEVREHPERFRPDVELWANVLLLHGSDAGYAGQVRAFDDLTPEGRCRQRVEIAGDPRRSSRVWALVGSVDGGPRPEVGQRVLVLESALAFEWAVGRVGVVGVKHYGAKADHLGVDVDDHPSLATRWALLPPVAAVPGSPAVPGGSGDAEPGEGVSPKPLRKACPGVLNIAGENFTCEQETSPHGDLACTNQAAEAIWKGGAAETERRPVYVPRPDDLGSCPAIVRDMPEGSARVCGGPVPCHAHPDAAPRRSLVDALMGDREVEPYVPSSRGTDPLTAGDIAMAESAVRHVAGAGFKAVFEEDVPRSWRLGKHWTGHNALDPREARRELATIIEAGIEAPGEDGRRPDDRLVGSLLRRDAEFVVYSVNLARREEAPTQFAYDAVCSALARHREEAERLDTLLTDLRAWLAEHRERAYKRDGGGRNDQHASGMGDAFDLTLDWLDERNAP